jgi:uncharacterized lipoprotein YehR (DUF1307 family)
MKSHKFFLATLICMMCLAVTLTGCKKEPPQKPANPLETLVEKLNEGTPKTVGDYTLVKAELSGKRLVYHYLLTEEQMKKFNTALTREEVRKNLSKEEMKNLVDELKEYSITLAYLYTDSINTNTFNFIPSELP